MFLRKLQSTLLSTVSTTGSMSASMIPFPSNSMSVSSSPSPYTTNSLSPTVTPINYLSLTPSISTTNYPLPSVNSQSATISPIYQYTNSYSPMPTEYTINPSPFYSPSPTVYSLLTPTISSRPLNIILPQSSSDDNLIIEKKYVGLFIGLTIFVIIGLLVYINYIYYKNRQLKEFIDSKKECVQQRPIGRVSVKNILTSI